jgi:hypothetical protein
MSQTMRDRRRVDELSIEELEQVLALRRREERMKRLEKLQKQGRVVESGAPAVAKPAQTIAPGMNLLEEDSPPPKPSQPRTPKASRRVANAFLTLVEVAAVFGLVFLGWQLYSGIGVLESRSAEAQQAAEAAVARSIPTIAPTPVVSLNQIVLPDYARVVTCVRDALARFAQGVYVVWYPVVGRAVSAQLPARLARLARAAQTGSSADRTGRTRPARHSAAAPPTAGAGRCNGRE